MMSVIDPSPPRPYDIDNPTEVRRLLHELEGYMRVSLRNGTDTSGRQFALDGLRELQTRNVTVGPA